MLGVVGLMKNHLMVHVDIVTAVSTEMSDEELKEHLYDVLAGAEGVVESLPKNSKVTLSPGVKVDVTPIRDVP